ncbi:MAG TPA: arsenite methyltransferase [Candidatus Bathyarchaeia archaeon]|nr:arsenite methyltransferase [Candidatus Bathyarchaeia archaeon]
MTQQTKTYQCCGSDSGDTTSTIDQEKARKSIREQYKNIASGKKDELSQQESTSTSKSQSPFYSKEELGSIPKDANLGLGSGNPVAQAKIREGDIVVDLGSGAGIDCFLAANKVGKAGKVIGVDMTSEMIDLARENAAKNGYENVEFRLGEIEHLPIADNQVNLIISNCVINLASDKTQVFKEAFRVLKPGGQLLISDIMFAKTLPEKVSKAFQSSSSCVSRAVKSVQYMDIIRSVGFENVELVDQYVIRPQKKQSDEKEISDGSRKITLVSDGKKTELELTPEEYEIMNDAIISAHVQATKPN